TPPDSEHACLAPVNETVSLSLRRILPEIGINRLSPKDFLFVGIVALGALGAVAWAKTPRLAGVAFAAVPGVLQLALTGATFHVIDGGVTGIAGRTSSPDPALSWIDHANEGRRPVLWLNNQSRPADGSSDREQRTTLFFNDD